MPDAQNDLVTVLNVIALLLSVTAVGVSGLAWFLSRAFKVRAFEGKVYAQLTTAEARIGLVEAGFAAHKLEIGGLTDEMMDAATKAGKERRRVYAENKRAEIRIAEEGDGEDPATGTREEQLGKVRRLLSGAK